MKNWNRIFYGLGILPWVALIPLLTFYFHAAIILRRLPSYNYPDPKDLDFYESYRKIIDPTSDLWGYSFLLWIILLIIYSILQRKKFNWKPIIFSGFGHLMVIFQFFNGVIGWYID
ncbi:hypothetical protein [Moheibacter lacus]|uniref:Uncharacterized protein n=1 Tax=Moheibacter lacus TaxID=2745851 RepID=A0A838ZJF2_9FLAO|nr:hypothetical protein [Moheibacter lacus]MBA5629771.1 hypothetical protein [Moheibacter lacus]